MNIAVLTLPLYTLLQLFSEPPYKYAEKNTLCVTVASFTLLLYKSKSVKKVLKSATTFKVERAYYFRNYAYFIRQKYDNKLLQY